MLEDESANSLIQYATALASEGRSDTVTMRGISADGIDVEFTFLLNPSTSLLLESALSTARPPSNKDVVRMTRDLIEHIEHPRPTQPETPPAGINDVY